MGSIFAGFLLTLVTTAQAFDASKTCVNKKFQKTKQVTHYMIPLLEKYDDFVCNKMEGTCIYKKEGKEWLHNYGYEDQPLETARCKNGYGNMSNCLHPCRVVAASMKHHRFGQIIFMKNLVGKKCGNMKRDGYEMIHDGYVVVADTGSPRYFNKSGRFDFFWGRCADKRKGVCYEGGTLISDATSFRDYCIVWDPRNPLKNEEIKSEFVSKVKAEAAAREDYEAATDFDLDKLIGPDFGRKTRELQN